MFEINLIFYVVQCNLLTLKYATNLTDVFNNGKDNPFGWLIYVHEHMRAFTQHSEHKVWFLLFAIVQSFGD